MSWRLIAVLLLSGWFQPATAQTFKDSVYVTLGPPPPSNRITPDYPGGVGAMLKYLKENAHYPAKAIQNAISGYVLVSFKIDTTGRISDAKISKRLGCGCDEEALRLVREMPRWKPGTYRGKPEVVHYGLPVRFGIPD